MTVQVQPTHNRAGTIADYLGPSPAQLERLALQIAAAVDVLRDRPEGVRPDAALAADLARAAERMRAVVWVLETAGARLDGATM